MLYLIIPPVFVTLCILFGQRLSREYTAKAPESFKTLEHLGFKVSMRNIWLVGMPLHYIVDTLVIKRHKPNSWHISVPILIIVQSFGYYFMHWIMHWYIYNIHELHHQFSQYVVPVAGICVSLKEYFFAYAIPVILAVFTSKCDSGSLTLFLMAEYGITIYIHCGFLDNTKMNSKYILTPGYHCAHHRRYYKRNLAAPIFTIPDLLFGTQIVNEKNNVH